MTQPTNNVIGTPFSFVDTFILLQVAQHISGNGLDWKCSIHKAGHVL